MFCTLYDGRIPRPRLSQGALRNGTSCDALSAKRVGSVTVADPELKACIRAMQLMRCTSPAEAALLRVTPVHSLRLHMELLLVLLPWNVPNNRAMAADGETARQFSSARIQ